MKILVTGCMGFIGSNLVPHLLNIGYEVIGIDNLLNPSINPTDRMKAESGENWNKFSFWNADIRDLQNIQSIFINNRPDYVVHLAALGSVPRSWDQPGLVTDINERGFVNVLQSATHLGVKKFIFASSSSVYGPTEKNIKWEGHQLFPASPYALTKVQNERFAEMWCGSLGIEWVALRFFNVYGPGQRFDSFYSAVIPRFINKDKIKIYGDGLTIRDFTYVIDVCNYIYLSIISEKKLNTAINIGSGFGTNLNRLAELVCTIKDKPIEYKSARQNDSKISIADMAKAKELLGITHNTTIEEGISKTYNYYHTLRNNI